MFAARCGVFAPNLHLGIVNPHIHVDVSAPVLLPTEAVDAALPSSFVGVMARGFGGSNVYMLTWATQSASVAMQAIEPRSRVGEIQFWPGGSGELSSSELAASYHIVGSWSSWNEPVKMEEESAGVYGYTLTVDVGKQAHFLIWMDGNSNTTLHPGRTNASSRSQVIGPEKLDCSNLKSSWLIEGSDVERASFRIRLHIAGQWRAVRWESLPHLGGKDRLGHACYSVVWSWSPWAPQVMTPVENGNPCILYADVIVTRPGETSFQIECNNDSRQLLHPVVTQDVSTGEVHGPDDNSSEACWLLGASVGDVVRVELDVTSVLKRRVSWRHLRKEALSTAQQVQASLTQYCVVGSWDGWRRVQLMEWIGDSYRMFIVIGHRCRASFQVLKEGARSDVLYPNCYDASTHSFHTMCGPSRDAEGRSWAIGAHNLDEAVAGACYDVRLYIPGPGSQHGRLRWSRVGSGEEDQARLADARTRGFMCGDEH
eukprot:TRINITY_DN31957_c0_g1_i2.p1 TRINITY_DN31957_c0_g1~~TRINITY_DN31957_c0_g1_i2.p1  ORF type:complete len:484 (-),score=33.12 TRINITY_DN31957_c0_g1_i2:50-1501(-)